MNNASTPPTPSPPLAIDPCHLGRPVHLLPLFTQALQDDLAEAFRNGMNRRYRAAFEVEAVTMACDAAAEPDRRWRAWADPTGRIGFAIDRGLLLAVLNYRYGARDKPGVAPQRETATEERLATMLGAQMAGILAARVEAGPAGMPAAPPPLQAVAAGPAPAAGSWIVAATVSEPTLGVTGRIRLAPDDAWMALLLRRLLLSRSPAKKAADGGKPLAARLHVRLTGRLLQKELALGELADLQVGSVLPVSLGAADVLIDDSRLFRAAVAERSGKLCLTSFEDVE